MARKATWYLFKLKHLSQMVSWGCLTDTSCDGFSRYVQIIADLNGREVVLRLTPGEARAIGRALCRVSEQVDEMNAEQENGGNYPHQEDWAL
jgi:hypothetical protein